MSTPAVQSLEAQLIHAKNETVRLHADAAKSIVSTIFRTVCPVAVFGIAVGASALLFDKANPGLHLVGLLIIWLGATLFGCAWALSGVLERRSLGDVRRLFGGNTVHLETHEVDRLQRSIQE
jgi:hypothetical protein